MKHIIPWLAWWVALFWLWLLLVGYGFIGGIGLGLGYISPVSTLVKWFPDRPGMATGMAIMGFGGGAFLAGYLNVYFMGVFGVAKTMIALGATYFIVMMIGARILRRPPEGWKPSLMDIKLAFAAEIDAAEAAEAAQIKPTPENGSESVPVTARAIPEANTVKL